MVSSGDRQCVSESGFTDIMETDGDRIFERAIRQARDSNASLAKMLPPDDKLLLSSSPNGSDMTIIDAQVVKTFIEDKANDAKGKRDGSKTKRISSFVNNVARFALNIQDIVSPLASQNPECGVPIGCLMIIFKVSEVPFS